MRVRHLHPAVFVDEEFGALRPAARLVFLGMWCLADREGRLQDRPDYIGARVLPYDPDEDGRELVDQLAWAGFITRYQVDGEPYIQIRSFLKYQAPHPKEKASQIPAQDGTMTPPPPDQYGTAWPAAREAALKRDGYACRECASRTSIDVHHLVPARLFDDPAKAHHIDNLASLCRPCHARAHAVLRAAAEAQS